MGFVVDKAALGHVFSEYFSFPCQSAFHQILHHHNHPGQVQQAIQWPLCRVDPAWTPPLTMRIKKIKKKYGRTDGLTTNETITLLYYAYKCKSNELNFMRRVQMTRVGYLSDAKVLQQRNETSVSSSKWPSA
jgi:hypothetical protein